VEVKQIVDFHNIALGFQEVHKSHAFDSELLNVLQEVQMVNRELNACNPPKSNIAPLRLRKRIRKIQYYILHKANFAHETPPEEVDLTACHLGILLYNGSIQNDFGVSPISKHLIQILMKLLLRFDNSANSSDHSCALRLWLLFLAGPLVHNPSEKSWFVHCVADVVFQLSLASWYETKALLETFAWVGKLQDALGQDLWGQAAELWTKGRNNYIIHHHQ